MKKILFLSGEDLELAKEEAIAVAGTKKFKQDKNLLILETENNLERLAFTKKVFRFLFSTKPKKLQKKIKSFDWKEIYKKDFCIRIKGKIDFKESEIASLIWAELENPKVNLKNPKTKIYFLLTGKKVYCGLLLHENKEKFMDRRPHLRKGFHPTSMQPKLARALVNLSRIKEKETLLDPFCGTGGILIEAGLVGCKLKGNDINKKMLQRTELNLKAFKLKAKLTQGDALKIKSEADAVVTDLPYGRGSYHNLEIDELYSEFLKKAPNMLKKGKYMVVVFPKKIKIKTKLKKIKELEFYTHHSLTRQIVILRKT